MSCVLKSLLTQTHRIHVSSDKKVQEGKIYWNHARKRKDVIAKKHCTGDMDIKKSMSKMVFSNHFFILNIASKLCTISQQLIIFRENVCFSGH